MVNAYLSIGSNIEPAHNFSRSAIVIGQLFPDPRWSPVYRSAAIGMQGPDFLNAAIEIRTDLALLELSARLKTLEVEFGRTHEQSSFSNRTLDIDILLYGDICIDTPTITVPRPELLTMGFVLQPLVDLIPNQVHPLQGRRYDTLLKELQQRDPEQLSGLEKTDLSFQNYQ